MLSLYVADTSQFSMEKLYKYVRWRWFSLLDMEEVKNRLNEKYSVEKLDVPTGDMEKAFFKNFREALLVRADTLRVYLAPQRAFLSQKEPMPFTKRDLELREMVLKLYPRDRESPFSFHFQSEPRFEISEK